MTMYQIYISSSLSSLSSSPLYVQVSSIFFCISSRILSNCCFLSYKI